MAEKQLQNRPEDHGMATEDRTALASPYGAKIYEIHVKGQLHSHWSEWLEGLEVKLLEPGEMILFGPIVDQAALIGVLNKLNRLNLTLLAVNEANGQNLRRQNE